MAHEQKRYMDSNRRTWNERTPVHARSGFYDVEGFKRGKLTLTPLEREELGDVTGKSLLHLQCHFGLDTLSWARLGANVAGVDFSHEAIDLAGSLSRELGIEAKFLESNIYDVPDVLARIHRRRASGQCPEAARGCSCESGIMVLKQQSRPQNKEHPIDATTQPSRSHPNRV